MLGVERGPLRCHLRVTGSVSDLGSLTCCLGSLSMGCLLGWIGSSYLGFKQQVGNFCLEPGVPCWAWGECRTSRPWIVASCTVPHQAQHTQPSSKSHQVGWYQARKNTWAHIPKPKTLEALCWAKEPWSLLAQEVRVQQDTQDGRSTAGTQIHLCRMATSQAVAKPSAPQCQLIHFFSFLFYVKGTETGGTERFSIAGSLPIWPYQPQLSQSKARSQELLGLS